ncbi:ArnT family glycosyltransferase [Sphaerotilus mobilis]|uniref:Glycosyltransferase RgtA/B/C/D-like domain-containing protein n=1 Tax=Sphaerotilus mobilis TaxID=47994 RepID=A0A4Q7LVI5_9BURK|nr:glycosyltransferase family 39 protein [Sphaerotilus mobilis]RZS58513.1 hypothetical protein EV685_0807 [Sphaerotilus mobilis]
MHPKPPPEHAGRAASLTIVAVVLAFAALRLATLLLALADGGLGLHVDEAQYWHWSTAPAWGYYSKPPVIAVLLAGSTAVFGDDVLGVKALALILYPLTALVLGLLAARMARDAGLGTGTGRPDRQAGVMAAALFMASPLAALLGLAATTDAPLMLCWALATWLLWQVRQANRAGHAARVGWLLLGLVCGIGLLSKYSFAAWILGALAWLWLDRTGADHDRDGDMDSLSDRDRDIAAELQAQARADALRGLLSAAGVTLALLLPHLAWNAAMGWPTLHHTAEITAVQPGEGLSTGWVQATVASLWRSLSVPIGALLMAGPLLVLLAGPLRRLGSTRTGPIPAPVRCLLALHLPLLVLGMLQALRGEPQINWVAPLVPGLILLLALALAQTQTQAWTRTRADRPVNRLAQGVLIGLIGVHTAVGTAIPLAQTLSQWWQERVDPDAANLPRRLDIWARMRGWPEAFAELRPSLVQTLEAQPDLPLLSTSRSVIAIGSHAWRDLPLRWRAWTEGGPPRSHYEMSVGWSGLQPHSGTVLIVADADLPAALLARLETPELLARRSAPAGRHSTVTLALWRAQVRAEPGPGELASNLGTTPSGSLPAWRSAR